MPITGEETLLYENKNRIVTITINRPERMNAISQELFERIGQALSRFKNDDDAWVAIITAAGDKAFSVGADMKDEASVKAASAAELPDWYRMDIWKPMIAAINGYCVALGWMIAQKCDIRIAVEHAQMGITEAQFNMAAAFAVDLPLRLSLAHALEIALWGDRLIPAQRAYEMGWVNRVVPKEQLMDEAMSWAERMLSIGPQAVRSIKEMIYRGSYIPPAERYTLAATLGAKLSNMEDTAEARRAFAEKRKPVFKNQ